MMTIDREALWDRSASAWAIRKAANPAALTSDRWVERRMAFLAELWFRGWDPHGTVLKIVEAWTPEGCTSEKHYKLSLYDYLASQLPGVEVTKEYGWRRTRIDIVIGRKVAIELKHNLNSTDKYQRLVGQLHEYRKWGSPIVVVLCGETDPNLKRQLSEEFDTGWILTEGARIITKTSVD